jgi:hypothetical protein
MLDLLKAPLNAVSNRRVLPQMFDPASDRPSPPSAFDYPSPPAAETTSWEQMPHVRKTAVRGSAVARAPLRPVVVR